MELPAVTQDVTFTLEELRLLLRALTIPECWNPRLRDEAAGLVGAAVNASQQLSLLAEGAGA
jgi:hypothetical protein